MRKATKSMAIVTVLLLALMGNAFGITWHTANQATIEWDAVTTNINGDPLPPDETVEYVVYLANAVTDPNKTNPAEVWRGAAATATITLNVEGRFLVGVKAVRKLSDGTTATESVVNWSDDPLVCLGGTDFGLRFYLPPMGPINLRPSNGG